MKRPKYILFYFILGFSLFSFPFLDSLGAGLALGGANRRRRGEESRGIPATGLESCLPAANKGKGREHQAGGCDIIADIITKLSGSQRLADSPQILDAKSRAHARRSIDCVVVVKDVAAVRRIFSQPAQDLLRGSSCDPVWPWGSDLELINKWPCFTCQVWLFAIFILACNSCWDSMAGLLGIECLGKAWILHLLLYLSFLFFANLNLIPFYPQKVCWVWFIGECVHLMIWNYLDKWINKYFFTIQIWITQIKELHR